MRSAEPSGMEHALKSFNFHDKSVAAAVTAIHC